MTAELSPSAWQLLHEVRLKGMVPGPDTDESQALVDAGYAARRNSHTVLTAEGREAHADWARVLDGSEEATAARKAYDRFLELDLDMKRVTTDWQLLGTAGASAGFGTDEWNLVDKLTTIDQRFGSHLNSLGKVVPRFAGYRDRLKNALEKLEDGQRQWFSGLTCDSYHTVWWQLHEDLLAALGIDRADDPNQ